jgi:capsular exopolysaccharide synthesis family protein
MMAFDRFDGGGSGAAEDRVDVRRYLAALRRDRRWIAAVVIAVTAAVFALSLVLPKSYQATATIVLDVQSGVFGPPDAESTQRRLATIESLLSSTEVLTEAAEEVGGGETAESLETKVDSSVDELTNLIDVSGTDGDPDTAAAIANAVAQSFLDVQQGLERERLNDAADSLAREAAELSGPGSAGEIDAINDRINDLRVQAASAGSDLQLAERALPPTDPVSPRPLRNSVLAFFAALFITILISLGRDQLRPVIGSPRELSGMFGSPVLSSVPYVPKRFSRSRRAIAAIEHEAYENLRSAVQMTMPPRADRGQVILVTSAVHAEGKTTVVGRLGRGLARAGHRTLIISADLRWPSLHQQLGLPLAPGLTDALKLAERSGMSDYILPATTHDVRVDRAGSGLESDLHVLTSGTKPHDPARLLASDAMRALVEQATLEYTYVLLDAPPVIGLADVQGLAALTDHVIFVAKLDRVTIDQAIDARELLERFGLDPAGLVVIGAKVDVSPYYVSERPPIAAEPASR